VQGRGKKTTRSIIHGRNYSKVIRIAIARRESARIIYARARGDTGVCARVEGGSALFIARGHIAVDQNDVPILRG